MALTRVQKEAMIEEYRSSLKDCRVAFLMEYSGAKILQTDEIRKKLRANASCITVVKNRLFKRAVQGTPFEKLGSKLQGPLALVTSKQDMIAPTKVIYPFFKNEGTPFKLRTAVTCESPEPLTQEQFTILAKLPSRDQLVAKMMGSMLAPLRNLMGVLTAVPRNLVYALSQVSQQKKE